MGKRESASPAGRQPAVAACSRGHEEAIGASGQELQRRRWWIAGGYPALEAEEWDVVDRLTGSPAAGATGARRTVAVSGVLA
jgi:hypothetical protein